MTAILAIWRRDGRPARDDGGRMLRALEPHGTDHQTLWSDGPVALGRALSRFLPEDIHDRQPVAVSGGRYLVVADVRLDNRAELAAALDLAPAICASLADSALLARAWERWNADCLDRLIGNFAFIVWDIVERRLFAARDHIGQRALAYFSGPGFIAIASMPKGLLALPDVPRAVDQDRLASLLAREPLDEDEPLFDTRTYYKGIHRVPPGHALTVTAAGETLRRYWTIEPQPTLRVKRDEDYIERANEIFDEAVRARLRRVGGIGSHLSSGLDSSAVTVTAARLLADQGERLTAFTAVPRDKNAEAPRGRIADEGPAAQAIVRGLTNVDHVLVDYPLRSPLAPLSSTTYASDMPIASPSNLLWAKEINAEARARKVRVMLDAPLGNFTLSYPGMERLPILLWQGRWLDWMRETMAFATTRRVPLWRAFVTEIKAALPPGPRWLAQRAADRQRVTYLSSPLSSYSALAPSFGRDFSGSRRRHHTLFIPGDRHQPSAVLARAISVMIGRIGPSQAAAGCLASHGIDLRSPVADKRLIDFCLALPLDQFCRDGRSRRLVTRMMRDRLPADVLAQRRRGYQGAGWLENLHLAQGEVLDAIRSMRHSAAGCALLDIDRLERLSETIPERGEATAPVIMAYRDVLLSGLAAAQFIRHVEGGNG